MLWCSSVHKTLPIMADCFIEVYSLFIYNEAMHQRTVLYVNYNSSSALTHVITYMVTTVCNLKSSL